MSPSTFAEAWGSVVTCFLVSSALNGCIFAQMWSYFSRFQNDRLVLKCAVAAVWLFSMLHFACACWVLHSVMVLGYDKPFYDVIIPIGLSAGLAAESIVHLIVQGTYIFRMYLFGRNRYILTLCCMLVLVQLGFGLTWAGRLAIGDVPLLLMDARNQGAKWVITSVFTTCASVDVFITVSLSSQLIRSRKNSLKRTKYLIDKIVGWTIPTGMLTSAVAIAIVLVWNLQGTKSMHWLAIIVFEPNCKYSRFKRLSR
ncbi:hypothetical protein BD779DRAFT_325748 [Infundibulicybe gibba]|nr:hypothetical protein BD779DRAFT_325748 [Infundibulicybe gibba]